MVRPIKITEENFKAFGQYSNLQRENRLSGVKYEEYISAEKYVYQPMRFGMTICKNEKRFYVDSMERHLTTEEILICGDKPIVLSVADSNPYGEPQAEDILVFYMEPGDVVMLAKGIWHDACQAVEADAFYYFMAHGTGKGDEIKWHAIQPAPVAVEI